MKRIPACNLPSIAAGRGRRESREHHSRFRFSFINGGCGRYIAAPVDPRVVRETGGSFAGLNVAQSQNGIWESQCLAVLRLPLRRASVFVPARALTYALTGAFITALRARASS